MKFTRIILSTITLFALTNIGQAVAATPCTQTGNVVGMTGLDSGGEDGVVFVSVQNTNPTCSCTSFRFNSIRTNTDKALSILLASKLANKKVRIDISDDQNCNTAYRVSCIYAVKRNQGSNNIKFEELIAPLFNKIY